MERQYRIIFIAVVAVKLSLAYFFPITSDEAYFYSWVDQPDFTYYDHPPMTGWLVYLFTRLGGHVFFPRLLSILCGASIAIGIYGFVGRSTGDREKARLISLFYLLSPLHMLFVVIATDTPLCLFVFFSGLLLHVGIRSDRRWLILISGCLWGLAILSKYFAGLLLFAYAGYFLIRRDRNTLINGFVWAAGAAPLILLHLYWNYNHCWTNVLFNVINRNRDVQLNIPGFFVFLGFQVYLATPWLLWRLFQSRTAVRQGLRAGSDLFACLYGIPLAVFGLVSLHNIGLHWTLSFYPFLFLLLMAVDTRRIGKLVRYSAVFSLLHVVPVMIVLSLPVETFRGKPYYHDLVLSVHGGEIYRALEKRYGSSFVMATNGYYTSGAMTYHGGERFIVFHDDSKHGRQDDRVTDFRTLDGRNILILSTLPVEQDYRPYFDAVADETIEVRQQTFYVTVGTGFRYAAYRDGFLRRILENWYDPPDFLPRGDCFFRETYFPETIR
ncbi:MAG: ArnT family glycosyltransferase [Thermodesulfobacteriota bacterium]